MLLRRHSVCDLESELLVQASNCLTWSSWSRFTRKRSLLLVANASRHRLRDTRLLSLTTLLTLNSRQMVQLDTDVRMDGPSSLPYDPDQDASEKRDIRKKYRALEKRTGGL